MAEKSKAYTMLMQVTSCEVAFESKLVYVNYAGNHQDEESKKLASQVIEAMDDIGFGLSHLIIPITAFYVCTVHAHIPSQ